MKKMMVFLSAIVICASASFAQNFDWAIAAQGKGVAEGNAVCLDAEGNSYITGYFSGNPFLFGKVALKNTSVNEGNTDMFVAKFDAKGQIVWAIQSEGAVEERGIDIACDKTGHIVVVGNFKGESAKFGNIELKNPTKNSFSTFILRINALGNILWAQRAGGKNNTRVNSVSAGPDGEIYITGEFAQGVTFGGYEYKSKSGNNSSVFVAKYLSNGELKWFEQIYGTRPGGQNSTQVGKAVFATSDSRFVYVAGWFRGRTTFGDSQIVSNTEPSPAGQRANIFITKYDSDGRGIWTKSIGQRQVNFSADPEITDIVADKQGSVYLTGYFPGVLIFGEEEMTGVAVKNSWNHDIFLAKYDADGKHLWHKSAGGKDTDYSNSIALTANGVMITGQVTGGDVKFGNIPLKNAFSNAFAANFDADGKCLWAIESQKVVAAKGNGIAANGTNTVITGMFLGSIVNFDNNALKGIGSGNFFATRIK